MVYRLWLLFGWPISRIGPIHGVPGSVFSAGKGVSSVDAWYSTAIDIEEVLSNTRQGDFHIFAADVVKSFDTEDPDILDCALGRLGLPVWFRCVYFSFSTERSGYDLNLPLVLGVAWTGDGASLKDAPSAWCLLLLSALLNVDIWKASTVSFLNFMRKTLSETLTMLRPYLLQPSTRSLMFN